MDARILNVTVTIMTIGSLLNVCMFQNKLNCFFYKETKKYVCHGSNSLDTVTLTVSCRWVPVKFMPCCPLKEEKIDKIFKNRVQILLYLATF